MAKNSLGMFQPKPHAEEPVPLPRFFVAQGIANKKVKNVVGVARLKGSLKRIIGRCLTGPPNWSISFSGLTPMKEYVLQIWDPFDKENYLKPVIRITKPLFASLAISYPLPGPTDCPVPLTFTSYGSSQGCTLVQGKMHDDTTGQDTPGNTTQQPDGNGNWAVQFTFLITSPHNFDLRVDDTAAGVGDHKDPITLQQMMVMGKKSRKKGKK